MMAANMTIASIKDALPSTAFDEQQFAEPYPDGIEQHYWTLARNRKILSAVQKALAGGEKQLVVDIGCGRGITLDYLRMNGIEVLGCELGQAKPISTEIAPFLQYDVDAAELPIKVRDRTGVLLLLDVLEHLPEPMTFLNTMVDAFSNAHTVIVTVPARQELWSNYDEYYGHFRRYDFASSKQLFDNNRFKVVFRGYLFRLLYLPALLLKRMGKKRGISIQPPKGAVILIHKLLARWFDLESVVLARSCPGTSLMLVLRRKPGS